MVFGSQQLVLSSWSESAGREPRDYSGREPRDTFTVTHGMTAFENVMKTVENCLADADKARQAGNLDHRTGQMVMIGLLLPALNQGEGAARLRAAPARARRGWLSIKTGPSPRDPYRHALTRRPPRKARPFIS